MTTELDEYQQSKMMMPKWTLWAGGIILLVGSGIAIRRMMMRKQAPSPGTAPSTPAKKWFEGLLDDADAEDLPAHARILSTQLFTVTGPCQIAWKPGQSAPQLTAHVDSFIKPGITYARERGAATVDDITGQLFGLLLPGCGTPEGLAKLDIDSGLKNELSATSQATFNFLKLQPTNQLYLAIRGLVAAQG